MKSLGILTMNLALEANYHTEIAAHAVEYNVNVFRFTPESIDPKTEFVHGEQFDHQRSTWEKCVFPIPNYLYDRCFYKSKDMLKKINPIVQWLKNRPETTFLGNGLPSKEVVLQKLSEDHILSNYIPKTDFEVSPKKILQQLLRGEKLLLKPIRGSSGKGIILLSYKDNQIKAETEKNKSMITQIFSSKREFLNWTKKLLLARKFICQPLLALVDSDGHPFDVRLLLQKDEYGGWIEKGRGIRRGQKGFITSNLHGSGSAISFSSWFMNYSKVEKVIIEDEIATIKNRLPCILENHFSPLFELGIDIGISLEGAVWLLDVNSKPGHQVITRTSPEKKNDIYKGPLAYCKFLQENNQSERRESSI